MCHISSRQSAIVTHYRLHDERVIVVAWPF